MVTDAETNSKRMIDAWNSHDIGRLASLFADSFVYEDMAAGTVYHDKNELEAGLQPLFDACPDVRLELKSAFGTPVKIAQEWVMTGTQTGAFEDLGIPATGKTFSIRGVSVSSFLEGKIVSATDYWNMTSMLQQLGLQ